MKRISILVFFLSLISTIFSLNIVTTINPYYLLVKDIVQDKAEVNLLLKPGVNPHVYSLKVSDVKLLNSADLIIANGYLEPYLEKYNNVFYISYFIPKILMEYENPHFWLDPFFAKYYIIPAIVQKLSELDPSDKEFYETNAKKIISEINSFIFESFSILKNINGKILVHHPSFYYYFKEFGIEIYWVEEGHNTSTSIKELLNIIKSQNIVAIFSEVQQSKREIEIISKELGKNYFVLDPLGIDSNTFIDLYNKNLNEIRKAVSNE
ncbi:MAG: zinc ABC transporter substrate-binding protein [Thermosipho sp. (in: Bacteria)]|nr:zinc ABC transporter substrate-binding protein [Thermosipho sp. (in: thermotogales)]MCD6105076.1 zinc ABC transporter substrate-binding protein [Thermosipho sp. (in: thermotogales)]